MNKFFKFLSVFLFIFIFSANGFSCTNILVTKGASADGSVIITYSCDGEFLPHLRYTKGSKHKSSETIEIKNWNNDKVYKIPQVAETYSVFGLINEFQVAIGETTFTGREELQNPDGLLHYWTLMNLALQRSKTAREAIKVITDLVEKYGYASTGESFSIGDKNEAWILEMIGTGKGGKGAVWVAAKVPDGYISAHANASRISIFPLNDKENCIYSKNAISFAIEKGYFSPHSGKPFRFNEVYCPMTPQKLRYTATRVWSIFRRAAPTQNFSTDYHRGVKGAKQYPLMIKPDKKLSLKDVISLMRDHYEGTPYDMTKGVDAGPFNCPNRWRPMNFKKQGSEDNYTWERPISTQQTGFSFISQSRDWLPNEIGGVYWYGLDDTYTTCYMPFYCCVTKVPKSFLAGSIKKYSNKSAWWNFNFVANFANLKYSYMIKDIQKLQLKVEEDELNSQSAIESTALSLLKKDKKLAVQYLTNYCNFNSENIVENWKNLGEYLITKYNDGYVQNDKHRAKEVGYQQDWLENVLKLRPNQFKLPKWEEEKIETKFDF